MSKQEWLYGIPEREEWLPDSNEMKSIRDLKMIDGGRALLRWLRQEREIVYSRWLNTSANDVAATARAQGACETLMHVMDTITTEEHEEEQEN